MSAGDHMGARGAAEGPRDSPFETMPGPGLDTATMPQPPGPRRRRPSFGRLSWSGLTLVIGLELRQRVRSTKWKWALALIAALIAVVTGLIAIAVPGDEWGTGDLVFGLVTYFVLFLGLVVSPTLTATSINGDSKEGTLAPLQATTLSAWDIVLGKLLASWFASLAILAVAVPFLGFAMLSSDAHPAALLTVIAVLAAELLVVCAMGLAWSALTARTASSAVLTYVTVAVLVVVLPILFPLLMLTMPVEREVTSTWRDYSYAGSGIDDEEYPYMDEYGGPYRCIEETYTTTTYRTDRLWWLLAVNPYVIVADSAPTPAIDEDSDDYYEFYGILDAIKQGVRELRLPPATTDDYCQPGLSEEELYRREVREGLSPTWPWGLGFHALLATGSVLIAVRRVAVPYGTLPRGTRVA